MAMVQRLEVGRGSLPDHEQGGEGPGDYFAAGARKAGGVRNWLTNFLENVLALSMGCQYIMHRHDLHVTWDPAKDATNARRHGIRFADAARIFDGPTLEREDNRFDYGEVRIYAIGLVNDTEVTVIYAPMDEDVYRLIAAWRAEPHERRSYWRNFPEDRLDPGADAIGPRRASGAHRRS